MEGRGQARYRPVAAGVNHEVPPLTPKVVHVWGTTTDAAGALR